jgi:hypothetical protein
MARHGRQQQGKKRTARSTRRADTNRRALRQQFDWLFPDATIFAKIKLHGNTTWTVSYLVGLALCWSWSESRHVTDAFTEALGWSQRLFGETSLTTYQGFMKALARWTRELRPLLLGVLQQRYEQCGGRYFRVAGWLPLAFDGSRSTAPRTRSNEAAFCASNYGRGSKSRYRKKKRRRQRRAPHERVAAPEPQTWITLLWHMGLRLPWDWRLGPSNASEREHVLQMVQANRFPAQTLFCGDAGFVGYPLWSGLRQAGTDFLVRVGANARLLTEQARCHFVTEGAEHVVYCWPLGVQTTHPPLRLRLVKLRLKQTTVWLLTSVWDRDDLTTSTLRQLYQMRWGIEVEFRGLKQTLHRAKLRCRNSTRLLAELEWSLLGMAVAELLASKEQQERRTAKRQAKEARRRGRGEPSRRSLAQTMRALRDCLKTLDERPAPGADLPNRLRDAVTDGYQRKQSKKARYRPRNPDKKPLGDPKLRPFTAQEKKRLRRFAL